MKTYISLILTGLILSGCSSLTSEQKACVEKLRGVEMARSIGQFWDDADLVGTSAAQKEFGLKINIATDEARAHYKEATAGIKAEVLEEVASRDVDAKAALEYMLSNIK